MSWLDGLTEVGCLTTPFSSPASVFFLVSRRIWFFLSFSISSARLIEQG